LRRRLCAGTMFIDTDCKKKVAFLPLLHQQNELRKTLSLNLNIPTIIKEHPQFLTATILEWKRLLKIKNHANIITLHSDKFGRLHCKTE
jgi:hypothetical protein